MDITLDHVGHRYGGGAPALQDVSLRVQRGRPLALLGRNGAGKTTLMKLLLGTLAPTAGRVSIPAGLSIGYLPEERGAYPTAGVQEQLRFFAAIAGVRDPAQAAEHWMERLDLTRYRSWPLKRLSKGNAQKVQLAISLVNSPDLAILDEPFTGLDPVNQELFTEVIAEHAASRYVVLSAHHFAPVEALCRDVVFVREGRVVAAGPVEDVKRQHGAKRARLSWVGPPPEAPTVSSQWPLRPVGDGFEVDSVNSTEELLQLLSCFPGADAPDEVVLRYPSLSEVFIRLLGEREAS